MESSGEFDPWATALPLVALIPNTKVHLAVIITAGDPLEIDVKSLKLDGFQSSGDCVITAVSLNPRTVIRRSRRSSETARSTPTNDVGS